MTRHEKAKTLKLKAVLEQLESCDTAVMRKRLIGQANKLVDFLLKVE